MDYVFEMLQNYQDQDMLPLVQDGPSPGLTVQTDAFILKYQGVSEEVRSLELGWCLEFCIDWRYVMEILLITINDYSNLADLEQRIKKALSDWMQTFSGWGFLFNLLLVSGNCREMFNKFCRTWILVDTTWDDSIQDTRSPRKIFETAKKEFEKHSPFHSIIPPFRISFDSRLGDGRVKDLVVHFFLGYCMELKVKFNLEKKMDNKNLVDIAAEKVVDEIKFLTDLEELEVPHELLLELKNKFKDVEWIKGFKDLCSHNDRLPLRL